MLKKGPTTGITAQNRFHVNVTPQGSLIPGNTITLNTTVRSLLPSSNAQIQLLVPAITALQNGGKLSVKKPLPTQMSQNVRLGKGQTTTRKTTVRFDKPGYYQVIAAASQSGNDKIKAADGYIKNSSSSDIWLWVNKKGGKVTGEYDSTLIFKNYRNQPGVLNSKSELPSVNTRPQKARAASTDETTIAVVYINQTPPMTAEPLASARMRYTVYDTLGRAQGSSTVVLDEQGEATIPCYEDFRGKGSYAATVHTQDNYRLSVYHYWGSDVAANFSGEFATDCGQVIPIQADYRLSHVFSVMDEVIENSRSFFQEQRGKVQVDISPNVNNSSYDPGSDLITIMSNNDNDTHIGGSFGDFTVAHEYGHALHEKGLGGNAASGSCPDSHAIDGAYNLQCAYSEGFADYHAVVSVYNFYTNYIESNNAYPAGEGNGDHNDGAIIEGAVAAFLYDLTDPANESHDNLDLPGSYIAEIIKDCEINNGDWWDRADGVDHLVACFQHEVPDYNNYFSTRSYNVPTNYRENVSEPSDWNKIDIRYIWRKNLYNETYTPPPPPSLGVTISGPTRLNDEETGTWSANVDNNDGPVSYQWKIRYPGGSTWYNYGNGSSMSTYFQGSNTYTEAGVKVNVSSVGETADTYLEVGIYADSPCGPRSVTSNNNESRGANAPDPCN